MRPGVDSVLLCAKGYPPIVGGVESYAEQVAQAYQRVGIRPTVVTSYPGVPGVGVRDYKDGSVEIINVGYGSQPVVLARLTLAVRRELRSRDFSFFHATTWRGGVALLPWLSDRPSVVTVHGREVLINSRFMRPLLRHTLRRFDVVAAVSDYTRQRLLATQPGLGDATVAIVSYNGLSYRPEAQTFSQPKSSGKIQIYSFCRLVERKNIASAIKAVAQISRSGVHGFEYIIAGDGPMRGDLQALIDAEGMTNVICMTGYISEQEVVSNFQKADIFLHPQVVSAEGMDIEGFGLVIADAMSFGAVPIVGKDGGPADFIVDGANGLLVDGNNIAEISDALETMIKNNARRQELALKAKSWAIENLSWDKHIEQIVNAVPSVKSYSQ